MPSIVQSGRVNVDITFLDEDDSMVTVTANRFELLEGYTSAYARTRRIDRSKLRFMLRGTEVKDNLTLDDMGCIGNDIIEVIQIYF